MAKKKEIEVGAVWYWKNSMLFSTNWNNEETFYDWLSKNVKFKKGLNIRSVEMFKNRDFDSIVVFSNKDYNKMYLRVTKFLKWRETHELNWFNPDWIDEWFVKSE